MSKPEDLKAEYERQGKIAALEAKKQRLKDQQEVLESILDPELNPDGAESEGESSEWMELRKYIGIHFSEAKEHANLSANQIMVGVATVLGWTPAKINRESGINKRTIHNWLKKPDVQFLIKELQIKKGQEDPGELVTSIGYKGLKFMDHMLSMAPNVNNKDLLRLQLDAAKFSVQQSLGKAAETVNVNEISYKDVAEKIYLNGTDEISDEEEEELFS